MNNNINIDHLTNADASEVTRVCWKIVNELQSCDQSEQLLAIAIIFRALHSCAELNPQDIYTWATNLVVRDEDAGRTFAGLCDYINGELSQ